MRCVVMALLAVWKTALYFRESAAGREGGMAFHGECTSGLPEPRAGYGAGMLVRLLWKPLPESWPATAPERPTGLRGLVARQRAMATGAPQRDDVERRVLRAAMQAIVREAFQQTAAEQDSEHRGPAERRRDIVRKTKDGLEAARRRGRVGGRRPVVDDDKRSAILARRRRGESVRTIAAGVKVSIGVVHKTLADSGGTWNRFAPNDHSE
ncbi:hypothetical protein JYK22_32310, partial [Nonomuraea sp. RK-328]|nr:hypothetical protein [Nonomuraea sp. RK-328]